jgi:GNAT superfamily N-acetyltransferase
LAHLTPHGDTSPTPDGSRIEIRAMRPADESRLLALHPSLSEEHLRPTAFGPVVAPSRDGFARLCRLDSAHDAGFVADRKDAGGASDLLGVSRFFLVPETNSAELALEVVKPWQGKGLGGDLIKPLIAVARERGIRRLITGAQSPMMSIATRFGFRLTGEYVDVANGTFQVIRDSDLGIDLGKYDPSDISEADVKLVVSSMYKYPGGNEEIRDFFLRVEPAHAARCLDELFHGPDPVIKSNAVELLVFLKGPESLPWIEECLCDDVDFRCAGCSFLAELDCPEALPRLLRCLREDPSDWVRYSAVDALERCGDMSAIPALKQTVKTDRGTDYEGRLIGDAAREAIRRITRRNRGTRPT